MRSQLFLLLSLSLSSLLLFSLTTISTTVDDGDGEDLRFLQSLSDDITTSNSPSHHHFSDDDQVDDYDDFDDPEVPYNDDVIKVNDEDVVVLVERNFTDVIEENRYVMVEFYAPWCGNCRELAPEYAAAATELKKESDVVVAKVDATLERELSGEYRVQGFPTLLFFVDGEHQPYNGRRTKEAIIYWVRKKTGPGIRNITTIEEAEYVLTSESKVVLGYLDSLVGPETEELIAASKLDDDVNFYQSLNPDVARLFHMDSDVKRPALVMLKREAEKVTHYDGKFTRSAISKFVTANKLPLVITFTRESGSSIFESPIKKQVMLFSTSKESEKVLLGFQEAAKHFKGKLLFVHIQVDNKEDGRPVAEYFGVSGNAPKVIGYLGNDDSRKYIFEGELTLEKIKEFAEDFLAERLKPIYKSDPIPESNDEDVKIVVGNNFDDIVLDESKDVLLEIYTPWCSHCRDLEPTYNKLAKHLHGIESLVIAKMDGSTNEHPRAKADGFPTLLFFPAGNKTSDPIVVETDRTVVALYKFLRRRASIPFKLQKPAATTDSESSDVNEKVISDTNNNEYKDDL
ncbi:chaperone [Lithospermum erythrorhizon]|uniref:Protein disulfide-isomerase n=1 Tax=Lithospermum erythrorhizon TaxID=34254 RepID=A0AAV3Q2M0_LITER